MSKKYLIVHDPFIDGVVSAAILYKKITEEEPDASIEVIQMTVHNKTFKINDKKVSLESKKVSVKSKFEKVYFIDIPSDNKHVKYIFDDIINLAKEKVEFVSDTGHVSMAVWKYCFPDILVPYFVQMVNLPTVTNKDMNALEKVIGLDWKDIKHPVWNQLLVPYDKFYMHKTKSTIIVKNK